jgi:hypothetical protein
MGTSDEYRYTAHVVIASDHAGLSPVFKAFERQIYRVLARVEDPDDVRLYLEALRRASQHFVDILEAKRAAEVKLSSPRVSRRFSP